jgi:hypothetical protein
MVTLGYIAMLRGDTQQASMLLQDGLRQLILAQETTFLLYGLLACAGFATILRRPLWAAALFGAGTHHAANVQLAFVRGVLALAHAHIEQAREQSDPEAFELAMQHGRSLALEEAVALAQSLLEEAGEPERVLEASAVASSESSGLFTNPYLMSSRHASATSVYLGSDRRSECFAPA